MEIKSIIYTAIICIITFGCSQRNKEDYNQLNEKAVELNDQGKTSEALRVLDQAIKSYPDSVLSYGNKMMILRTEKKYKELNQLFNLMIERKVNHQTAYAYKGILYELNDRIDSACILYKLGHEVGKKLDIPDEEKELDYVLYLKMVHQDSLASSELNRIRNKYQGNEFVESFGQVLDSINISEYKKQLVNVE